MILFFFPQEDPKPKETKKATKVKPSDLLSYLRTTDISVILFRQNWTNSKRIKTIINGYNTTLGFYYTALTDPRFDVLTPPPKLYDELPIGLDFELFEDKFSISSPRSPNKRIIFEYKQNAVPLLSCLETLILTKELCEVIRALKAGSEPALDHGMVACRCTDHRFSPKRVSVSLLSASHSLLQHYVAGKAGSADSLRREKRLLLQQRPVVCTDPSHNVARVQRIIDWRKKMWTCRSERGALPPQGAQARPQREKAAAKPSRIPLRRARVEFPAELHSMISGMGGAPVAMNL